jgi:hypothetical protein
MLFFSIKWSFVENKTICPTQTPTVEDQSNAFASIRWYHIYQIGCSSSTRHLLLPPSPQISICPLWYDYLWRCNFSPTTQRIWLHTKGASVSFIFTLIISPICWNVSFAVSIYGLKTNNLIAFPPPSKFFSMHPKSLRLTVDLAHNLKVFWSKNCSKRS